MEKARRPAEGGVTWTHQKDVQVHMLEDLDQATVLGLW
jgi:hypothetical protein